MNSTKRKIELTGAIISLILGIAVAIFGLIAFLSKDLILKILEEEINAHVFEKVKDIIDKVSIVAMAYGVVLVLFGSILCSSPTKKGVYKKRIAIHIILIALVAVLFAGALINISYDFNLLLIVATGMPFIFLLVSVFLPIKNIEQSSTNETQNPSLIEQPSVSNDKTNEVKEMPVETKEIVEEPQVEKTVETSTEQQTIEKPEQPVQETGQEEVMVEEKEEIQATDILPKNNDQK